MLRDLNQIQTLPNIYLRVSWGISNIVEGSLSPKTRQKCQCNPLNDLWSLLPTCRNGSYVCETTNQIQTFQTSILEVFWCFRCIGKSLGSTSESIFFMEHNYFIVDFCYENGCFITNSS